MLLDVARDVALFEELPGALSLAALIRASITLPHPSWSSSLSSSSVRIQSVCCLVSFGPEDSGTGMFLRPRGAACRLSPGGLSPGWGFVETGSDGVLFVIRLLLFLLLPVSAALAAPSVSMFLYCQSR